MGISKTPLVCTCKYTTQNTSNFKKHLEYYQQKGEESAHKRQKVEEQRQSEVDFLRSQLLERDRQINEKDKQLTEKEKQLAEKDKYIQKLQKRPTVVVDNSINIFGKESLSHITPEQIDQILADPENAVPQFIKIKHSLPCNQNVRCINKKDGIYQITVGEGEDIKWENIPKGEVLEQMYETNSSILEGQASHEEHLPFYDHQDKINASIEGKDKRKAYQRQLDKIHLVVTNP